MLFPPPLGAYSASSPVEATSAQPAAEDAALPSCGACKVHSAHQGDSRFTCQGYCRDHPQGRQSPQTPFLQVKNSEGTTPQPESKDAALPPSKGCKRQLCALGRCHCGARSCGWCPCSYTPYKSTPSPSTHPGPSFTPNVTPRALAAPANGILGPYRTPSPPAAKAKPTTFNRDVLVITALLILILLDLIFIYQVVT